MLGLQHKLNPKKDDTGSNLRWGVVLVILALLCSLTRSAELNQHLPPLLPSVARAIDSHLYYSLNKINHKSCKAGHKTGVCMFVWECMKTRGHHSGMCMDGFMFGSCCTHEPEDEDSSTSASIAYPQSVSVDKTFDAALAALNQIDSQKTISNDRVTAKPHLSTRPSYSSLLRPVYLPLSTTATPTTTERDYTETESSTSLSTIENTTPALETLNLRKTTTPVTIKPPKAPTRPTRPPKPPKPVRPTLKPWWIYSHKTKKPSNNIRTTMKPTSRETTTATTPKSTTTPSTTKTFTTTRSTLPPSHGPFTTNVHSKHVCGMQRMSPQPEGRIVNGTNSRYGEFPWQTSVRRTSFFGFSSTHRCGGALLNSKWVATAGHCVDDLLVSQIRLRVGEYDFSSVLEPYAYVERRAKKKVVHPNYNFFTYEYDLALVEMESSVEFQPHIQPICLPGNQDLLIGEMARVTGWGRLSEHGTLPSILQQASVPIMSNRKCQQMFLNGGRKEDIPDIFLCAGYEYGGRDSCQGDSGGPLQVKGADGRWFLAGIISWGIGCAEPNLPGVCTRISKFVPFILEHVTS